MNSRTLILVTSMASAVAVISAAWGFELIGGYVPCKLCLAQRIPYYVGIPLLALASAQSAIGLVTGARLFAAAAGLCFLVGAWMGGHHAGVEWGFWPGPTDCAGGIDTGSGIDGFLAQLNKTKVVSCTEAAWRFVGLSFAGWNAIFSAGLAVVSGLAAFPVFRFRRD